MTNQSLFLHDCPINKANTPEAKALRDQVSKQKFREVVGNNPNSTRTADALERNGVPTLCRICFLRTEGMSAAYKERCPHHPTYLEIVETEFSRDKDR